MSVILTLNGRGEFCDFHVGVMEHSVLPGTDAASDISKKRSVFIHEGLDFNKSDSVLNQPLVTKAQNRGCNNVAGGPREDRESGF
jgi:hypothetical protein